MIIPIVAEDGGLVEWAMVELQGRIEPQLELKPGAPLPVGTLQLSPAVRANANRVAAAAAAGLAPPPPCCSSCSPAGAKAPTHQHNAPPITIKHTHYRTRTSCSCRSGTTS